MSLGGVEDGAPSTPTPPHPAPLAKTPTGGGFFSQKGSGAVLNTDGPAPPPIHYFLVPRHEMLTYPDIQPSGYHEYKDITSSLGLVDNQSIRDVTVSVFRWIPIQISVFFKRKPIRVFIFHPGCVACEVFCLIYIAKQSNVT